MSDNAKKAVAVVVAVVLVGYVLFSLVGGSPDDVAVADANSRILMDSQTGELFKFSLEDIDGPYPLKNPKTGTKTLYPTEVCYARSCANKPNGTHVILNVHFGKDEPTYCPECGALVRFHNPGRSSKTASQDEDE